MNSAAHPQLFNPMPEVILSVKPITVARSWRKNMNKEFLQYLQKCPPQQLQLWTWLYTVSDDSDAVSVNLGELRLQFRLTPKVFTKVLGLDEMQGRQFISYQQESKSIVHIQFNKIRNLEDVDYQQETKEKGIDKTLTNNVEKQKPVKRKEEKTVNEEVTLSIGNDNAVIVKDKDSDVAIRKVEFSTELKDGLLDDYSKFFVSLQKSRNSLAGEPHAPALPPKIDGADIRFFKMLTNYFRKLPRKSGSTEPLSDAEVRDCFRRMYVSWDSFDTFIQNGVKPQQMWFNLNNIIAQLTLPRKTKHHTRNAEFDKKTDNAGQRDFSHLLDKRKGTD